jgi:hypothetical protein
LSIKNKYITLQSNCSLVLTHLWLNCKKVKIRGALNFRTIALVIFLCAVGYGAQKCSMRKDASPDMDISTIDTATAV